MFIVQHGVFHRHAGAEAAPPCARFFRGRVWTHSGSVGPIIFWGRPLCLYSFGVFFFKASHMLWDHNADAWSQDQLIGRLQLLKYFTLNFTLENWDHVESQWWISFSHRATEVAEALQHCDLGCADRGEDLSCLAIPILWAISFFKGGPDFTWDL